jgi:hypothetical protein
MSDLDLIAKKIAELKALRNPKFDIAAFALGMIGVTLFLLMITIAILLG